MKTKNFSNALKEMSLVNKVRITICTIYVLAVFIYWWAVGGMQYAFSTAAIAINFVAAMLGVIFGLPLGIFSLKEIKGIPICETIVVMLSLPAFCLMDYINGFVHNPLVTQIRDVVLGMWFVLLIISFSVGMYHAIKEIRKDNKDFRKLCPRT